MEPIYEIDFSALSAEEKMNFMYTFRDSMKASFQEMPFSIQLLAHILIFTRWWNSYKHMAPNEPTPKILETAIELLWDFQRRIVIPKHLSGSRKVFATLLWKF